MVSSSSKGFMATPGATAGVRVWGMTGLVRVVPHWVQQHTSGEMTQVSSR
jgi:hypothetical protein